VRHAINELEKLLPPDILKTEQAKRLHAFGCVTEMDIVLLIYRPFAPQGAAKDYEFSRGTMEARWRQGVSDATRTLQAAPWLAPKASEAGVRVFDVMHNILLGQDPATTKARAENADRPPTQPVEGQTAEGSLPKKSA